MTSEQRYDISPQPADTCPLINALQKDADKALRRISRYERLKEEADIGELHDMLWAAQQVLEDLGSGSQSALERIRKRVEEVRYWGQEWKQLCKDFIPPFNEDFQI